MCPPDFYDVRYEINPWMSIKHPADQGAPSASGSCSTDSLSTGGAEVQLVEPIEGVPDLVFTANAGLVVQQQGRACQLPPSRATARAPRLQTLVRTAASRSSPARRALFRGGGRRPSSWARPSSPATASAPISAPISCSASSLGVRAVSLELTDPRFYHLDTCFCPLDRETALYYPGAFDDYGRRAMADASRASSPSPRTTPCVCLQRRRRSVRTSYLQKDCYATKSVLIEHGFAPHEVDLTEFLKAGGSAKCLTLFLDHPAGLSPSSA